jgi:hypothetical protein
MFARLCSMPHDSCVSGTGEVQFGASDLIASACRLTYKSWAPEQHQIRFDIPVRILMKHKKTADGKSSGIQLKPADIPVFQRFSNQLEVRFYLFALVWSSIHD